MRIILASRSPRRKGAFDLLGLPVEQVPSKIDEKLIRDDDPIALSRKLAEAKALDVGQRESSALVVASDVFVVFQGKIYEKPATKEDAFDMLSSFSGKELEIISSIAVYNTGTRHMDSAVERCTVRFRMLTASEINDYIKRHKVLDFAAAFDGDGMVRFGESFKGNLLFLHGIPVNQLILMLRKNGIEV